ncbi:MAG: hypothetical protein ACRDP1_00925 [Nocardioidaceae bacterium]
MYPLPDAPAAYQALIGQLVAEGFVAQISNPDDTAFGNQIALLIHDGTRLRLVRDRSQWFLEIAAPLTDEWFAPVIWMAFLDGELPDPRRPSAEDEAGFAATRWHDFDASEAAGILEGLRVWQERRAAQRRGLPPGAAQ